MTYYANKLKKEYKDKYVDILSAGCCSVLNTFPRDPKHIEWVNHCISLVEAMKAYAKEYHPTGPSWNAKVGHN